MKQRLTEKIVREAKAPATGSRITYDDDVRGFGVRITAKGVRAFVLEYSFRGHNRRYTIGRHGEEFSVVAARIKARSLRRRLRDGIDIAAEPGARTVAELADRYEAEYLPRKSAHSQNREARMLDNDVLPALGRMAVSEVGFADIYALHRKITRALDRKIGVGKRRRAAEPAPIRANRVLALCSRMFALAVRPWELRADNPCKGIERNPENRRNRYLSGAELMRLGAALATDPSPVAASAVRFLVLTGARAGEVLGATWGQFDLAAGVWTKPAATTKQRREHRVPLSAPARQVLAERRGEAELAGKAFVFPGRNPDQALARLHHVWERLRQAAELEDVRLHDLRHAYASIAVSGGATLPLIGALLGHTQAQTTMRYAHLLDDPLRAATEKAGAVIASALAAGAGVAAERQGEGGGRVVPLKPPARA